MLCNLRNNPPPYRVSLRTRSPAVVDLLPGRASLLIPHYISSFAEAYLYRSVLRTSLCPRSLSPALSKIFPVSFPPARPLRISQAPEFCRLRLLGCRSALPGVAFFAEPLHFVAGSRLYRLESSSLRPCLQDVSSRSAPLAPELCIEAEIRTMNSSLRSE